MQSPNFLNSVLIVAYRNLFYSVHLRNLIIILNCNELYTGTQII